MKRMSKLVIVLVVTTLCAGVTARGQDDENNLRRKQQGLVGGSVISAEARQELGLLTLDNVNATCSASLLRNNWAITAAHCVESAPSVTFPENSVTLTANWPTPQVRQSARIITFRPNDVAIIRFDEPFDGRREGYNRRMYEGDTDALTITFYGRGINQFAFVKDGIAQPSLLDDLYRTASFTIDRGNNSSYSFPNINAMPAGGDSGGPSYVRSGSDDLLVGVHSTCQYLCMSGKTCAAPDIWTWAISTPRCTDASVGTLRDTIDSYLGAFIPPGQFVGTFGRTPPNYQPIWVYAIKDDGDMLWYRKDTAGSAWQGPKKVGNGWDFKDVIPAGGNSIYALTADGRLMWYRHDGFNDGSRNWPAPVEVGHGWAFSKIFSGGEGIIYAIKENGDLMWYRHGGYADGGGPSTWAVPVTIGARWNGFKDVFSNGEGNLYAVRPNGELIYYHQPGYATGERRWLPERTLATGWQNFRQIIPAGGGVILAVTGEGKLLWYRHYFKADGPLRSSRVKEHWEGPTEIGSGWVGFKKIMALLPVPSSAPVVR